MTSYDRGAAIADRLSVVGIRAAVDPSAITPPAVLVLPPDRTYNLACGFTARWTLVAIAPASSVATRSTWMTLDDLVDTVARYFDITEAELVSYSVNGTAFPAYLLRFEEDI